MPTVVDHEARRREIVDALWRVVARDGAGAVSVRSVAREAGLSKTGMRHYFESQAALLAMAIEQSIETVTDRIVALDLIGIDTEIATDALLAMIPDTEQRRRQSEIWLLLLAQANGDPTVSAVLRHLNDVVRAGIEVVLTTLRNHGHLAPDCDLERETATLHALVDGLSVQVLTDQRLCAAVPIRCVVRGYLDHLHAARAGSRPGAPHLS